MAQEPRELRERVNELERRLSALEQRLGAGTEALEATGPNQQSTAPAAMHTETPEPFPVPRLHMASQEPLKAAAAPTLPVASSLFRRAVEPRAAAAPRPHVDLERLVGMRVFAAIGAIVVVIGAGLFLKLAYDRGWLNLIPPLTKCITGGAFGAALLIAGEILRRRWGSIASVGVSAAGLGVLFASVFAAHGVYHLMHPAIAFVLLAAVAALGFVVAARGQLASIAVLALLAAYVNPIIIEDPRPSPWTLPVYLLVILCTGLALSAWRARPFRMLRGLVWWEQCCMARPGFWVRVWMHQPPRWC